MPGGGGGGRGEDEEEEDGEEGKWRDCYSVKYSIITYAMKSTKV